ncbi:type II toxin-antitoxin system RelE/ParE family toxin [Flavobacterium sp. ov086]|uniref:type II toxin-antitoxin system RelE/ParE family toxin n=1 Tax=Flavobacterium sp. ov086 TaxID=1761785 RepID=UPI000B63AE3A|nr:type II toxin-antitoxin system RelE/ParE family toxin [Flavobacterium sp. ov086]SNR55961.1 ParE toxin of type II toxin-antitoxin system, parDE [Flavobacterium sp. ov086]
MKVSFTTEFILSINEQVDYIARDKPIAARKFKNDLLKKLKKDLVNPFHFKKSIHFSYENIRDYVFKGYVSVYEVDVDLQKVSVFAFIKYRNSL